MLPVVTGPPFAGLSRRLRSSTGIFSPGFLDPVNVFVLGVERVGLAIPPLQLLRDLAL